MIPAVIDWSQSLLVVSQDKDEFRVDIYSSMDKYSYKKSDSVLFGHVRYELETGKLEFEGLYLPIKELFSDYVSSYSKIRFFVKDFIEVRAIKVGLFRKRIERRYSLRNGFSIVKEKYGQKIMFLRTYNPNKVTIYENTD